MAGLETEYLGLVKREISRGPAEIEFFDGNGVPYDVKTPLSPHEGRMFEFNKKNKVGKSLIKQLNKSFPNGKTGVPEPVKVILDSTFLNKADHSSLWKYLDNNATPAQLENLVEINLRLNK